MEVTGESRVENIGHNLILKGRGAGRTGRLEGSLVVDQIHPLQNALTAKVLVDPTEDGRAFKASAVWPDNRLALEGDMHFTSASDFGVGLQFLSPFEAVKDAGLMVKHKFVQDAWQDLGWKVQSEARVAWLLDNAMALTLDADLDSLSAFDARAELSLPLPRWNRASVSLRNRPQPDVRGLSTGFEAAIAGHKLALTADGSLGVLPSDKRYGTVTLTLPAGPVQQLTVAASVQRSKPGVYETFFSPVWRLRDGTSQEIRLTSVVDLGTSGAGSLQANLRLLTPWLDMLFLELHHAPTSPGDFVTRLVGSLGRQSVHLRGQLMGLREQKGYKFLLNTTSNIQFIPAFDAMTTVVTYPSYRMMFSAWTPKEYRLTVTSDRSTAASTVIETELRTPLSGVELVRARVELEQRSEERALSAEVTLPSREQIRVSGTLAPMDLRLSVTTPFDGIRTGSLRLSMGVVAERLNPVLRISWDRYKVELIGTAIPGEDDSRPTQVTGSLLIDVPVGPRVTGNFQLSEHAGSRGLVYDLTAASTVDQNSYQMEGQIFTGAQKAGFDIRTTSSDPSAHISAAVVVTVNAVPGVVGLRVQLNTPHEPIRDVSLSVEYKTGTDGRQLGAKLRHPQLTAELGSRLALVSWRHFHVGLNGKLNMGQLDLRRSVSTRCGGHTRAPCVWCVAGSAPSGRSPRAAR
ncbi:uncharacterized protein LOC119092110 [Pollicipes pollicipes]|uniref:uncharacterized protein LOC119092110 n=1 Tax=Pollicipes pollicipes TaxID=41117 RepID=UPI0018857305|nr:uncharacterized protein LOC119092110 [Pollicipes pollicipes]